MSGIDHLRGARVLVTGAAGFIGSSLVRALIREGSQVHALVRPGGDRPRIESVANHLSVHPLEMTDVGELGALLSRIRPELIFHLAAAGGQPSDHIERLEALKSTVLGTASLLEATAPLDYERFVHIGSSMEYGPKEGPINETERLDPTSYRGVTKAASTLLVQQFALSEGRPITILRPFSVYGCRQPERGLIPTAIKASLYGQEIALTAPGYKRDYVYVDDVVAACLLCTKAEHPPGEIFNIGTGRQWSNEEVVEVIETLSGRQVKRGTRTYPARPYDTSSWVADIRKARKSLEWTPQHTLEDGLVKTIDYFRDLWGL